ncbi:MAG: polyhydroxyalkanoate depolymerase [Alphaproteobacteria bacterium]|nr:polyhydroxyalkanoate depolymerase [Alphaproteobacteria bacterium]
MLYTAYEATHAAISPLRVAADVTRRFYRSPINPTAFWPQSKAIAAACDVFERVTRRYGKPEWGIAETQVDGETVPVRIEAAATHPFCTLLHFCREPEAMPAGRAPDPAVLIVAPLSGHYATLLRGTVEAMLPEHDVYITDWHDARMVPVNQGRFGLEDYVDYIVDFLRFLGPDTHVLGVCQPGPAVLAATSVMAAANDPCQPASITLMGSPIDTRKSPTVPNQLATSRPLDWFEQNVISLVPWPNPGMMRRVYPGFLQLTGFMTMNLDRHVDAHLQLFRHLITGDGESADAHRKFYDEYNSVLDLTADFYLETVKVIFQEHDLPDGRMRHRGELVQPAAIRRTALMTVEGEKDDISGVGQTQAAHGLCTAIPAERRRLMVAERVGHYGIFNGRRWREQIQPQVRDFIRTHATLGPA